MLKADNLTPKESSGCNLITILRIRLPVTISSVNIWGVCQKDNRISRLLINDTVLIFVSNKGDITPALCNIIPDAFSYM